MSLIRSLWARLRGSQEAPAAPASAEVPPTRVIVGLGNPGAKYLGTRHNIGFRVLECVAERTGAIWRSDDALEARVAHVVCAGQACLLVAPQTFMNRSGRSVERVLERWPSLDPRTDLLIVYDDMDLPTGRIRLRPNGGGGGHRGIGDILEVLETKEVPRLRFGVGHPGSGDAVLDWVLAPFGREEEAILEVAVPRAAEAVETAVGEGVTSAMGQFNAAS